MTPHPRPQGSQIRTIAAVVCLFASFVILPAGFLQMVRSLERGGYETGGVSLSFWTLGLGGGLLGTGIALIIWELSIRHNIRH